ncbi:AAA family ATPase [Elizabethkingia meningoseptica]|uniref:AAA family ATPase n=1 Tax=Elizabethkingia meningoseptica TaxID=238 RepID=UPI003891F86F
MITKINLNNVASYKSQTTLETDKRINLIYGLNGTGKSTLSNFLHKKTEERFSSCSIEGLDDNNEILVYNQFFIQENFFEPDDLKGIFTLSKENKEAETKIINASKEVEKLTDEKATKIIELEAERLSINQKLEVAKNTIWKIKTDYSGGDRVLEFCLDGYKGAKESLFNQIIGLVKSTEKPTKTIDDLKYDFQSISGDNAQKYIELAKITFTSLTREEENLLSKQIVGNENSTVSQLIKELGNSDWVKAGLEYLPTEPIENTETCPFCQEKTISESLVESIKDYFDASYEADINSLKSFLEEYSLAIQSVPSFITFETNPKIDIYKKDFEIKYNALIKILEDNKKLIEEKIKTPSISIILRDVTTAIDEFNEIIEKTNTLISEHNRNIDQITIVKADIKQSFWQIMRWDYDQTITSYNTDKTTSESKIETLNTSIKDYSTKISQQNSIISEQQKQTVNIDEAVTNINNSLFDLGITDFSIKKYSDNLYRIVRGENEEKIFRSLSEGERMIISFLYFIELCRGKKDVTETGKKKIVVIDDPISSLSHIYVFNIGRLIHNEFMRSDKYEQIFLLTHSLYFFYEMTDTNKERRKEQQKLFRIGKNTSGSSIIEMHYEEIQNDYHSYWFVIKDDQQSPALIANCMRNIIEYFFNFVEKKDLNNVFQKPIMQENRFQAFNRYINRESHSLGQNIFDIKEFNYTDFKDAFASVFKENGYEEHYKKMMK